MHNLIQYSKNKINDTIMPIFGVQPKELQKISLGANK